MASSSSSGGVPGLPPLIPVPPAGIDPDALNAATAAVRLYCGWHIAPVIVESVVLDGPGGDLLMLPTLRLVDLADVKNDGASVVDPQWSRAGMVRHWSWSSKFRSITATMTHGFDACPDDLVGVLTTMASAGLVGMQGQTVGPFSLLASSGSAGSFVVSPAHKQVLDKYRLPPLP